MMYSLFSPGLPYLRFFLAFAGVFIVPGLLLFNLVFDRKRYRFFEIIPLSFSLSAAVISTAGLILYSFRLDVTVLLYLLPAVVVALAAAGILKWRKNTGAGGGAGGERGDVPFVAAFILLLVLASLLMLYSGATFKSSSDSFDHVGTVREIVDNRQFFPTNSYYAGEQGLGADPRKGFFHVGIALVSILSGVDPFRGWYWLPSLFLPVLLCTFFAFTASIFGGRGAAFVSTVLFLLCFKGTDRSLLRVTGFPLYTGFQIYLTAFFLFFRHLTGREIKTLVLAAFLGYVAATVHIYYFVQFCLALLSFFIFALIMKREDRYLLGSLVIVALLTVIFSVPFLMVKYKLSYAISNPFDEQPRHLLYLYKNIYVVNPVAPWRIFGPVGIFAFFLTPFLYRRAKKEPGLLFLFAGMIMTPLIIFNPAAVHFLGKVMTLGLIRRIALLAPYIAVTGYFVHMMILKAAEGGRRGERAAAAVFLLVTVCLLVPYIKGFSQSYSPAALESERRDSPFAWIDALKFIENEIKEPAVFLADPYTSFGIPAFTKHYIVAVPIGHSSPKDARNVEKVKDARDALNPYTGIRETLEILDKYRVDYVILNQTFESPIYEYSWSIDPGIYRQALDKFESRPALFEKVYDKGGVYIFRYIHTDEAAGPGPAGLPVPFVLEREPALENPVNEIFDGAYMLLGAEIDRKRVRPGERVSLESYWIRLGEEAPPRYYRVFVRFDTDFPKNRLYRRWYGKIYRKLVERAKGERYRFRSEHNPVSGIYPPDTWKRGEVVVDRAEIAVPGDAAPGIYDIRIKLLEMPFNPNYKLSDFLRDDDIYSGVKVGTLEIER